MDFVVGSPMTQKQHDVIWVVVDWLTKSAHFLAVKAVFNAEQLVDFGKVFSLQWAQSYALASLFIPRQMVSLKEPFKR